VDLKNHNQLCAAFALVNLYMHRKRPALWRRSVSGERSKHALRIKTRKKRLQP
jgi:hypothetical protein